MKVLSYNDTQLFKQIASMEEKVLLKTLGTFLERRYNKVIKSDKYLCAEGNIPIALVAHLDTVFTSPPDNIYYDEKAGIMWSPEGLGADDRAGVYAILKIIRAGYKPHIIFTTDEEIGGKGAQALAADYPMGPFKDIKYIIELDRQGKNDCVFYNCNNIPFVEYVESFGFLEEWGTFSDISVLCPYWGIAGVNLSIGYQNEHTYIETLNINVVLQTIKRVVKMLEDVDNVEQFEYIPTYKNRFSYMWNDYLSDEIIKCDHCGREFFEFELVPVKSRSGGTKFYCPDCLASSNIAWCSTCFEAYEVEGDVNNSLECYDCRKMRD